MAIVQTVQSRRRVGIGVLLQDKAKAFERLDIEIHEGCLRRWAGGIGELELSPVFGPLLIIDLYF
jgi:hypothetical protein